MSEKTEHEVAAESLSAYLDGDLEPAEKQALEQHLQHCAGCRRQLELLRRSLALVRSLPAPEAPAQFAPRLRLLARRRGLVGRRRRPETARWMISFEAAVLLFLVTTGCVLLLLYFMDLPPPLDVRPPSVTLTLTDPERLPDVLQAARECGALIQSGQRLLPPDRPPPPNEPLALILEPRRLACLRNALAARGLGEALHGEPPAQAGGLLVIPVRPAADGSAAPRAPARPASEPDRR